MKFRILYVFLLLALACSRGNKEDLIPRKQFTQLLTEIHLFDALATEYVIREEMRKIDSATLYSSIFAEYGVDQHQFDNTLKHYTRRPKEFEEIYNDVFAEITKINEEFKSEEQLYNSAAGDELLHVKSFKQFKGDTIKYPAPYVVELKGKGTYLFEVKARIFKDDKAVNPEILVYLFIDDQDRPIKKRLEIIRTPMLKLNFARTYQYAYELQDETFKYAKIFVPYTPNRDNVFRKHLQVTKVRVLKLKEEEMLKEAADSLTRK
jgi:hypothetical protein